MEKKNPPEVVDKLPPKKHDLDAFMDEILQTLKEQIFTHNDAFFCMYFFVCMYKFLYI